MTPPRAAARFVVRGVVQGVGFRPFVARLASRLGLAGGVRNTSGTVHIVVEGPADAVEAFAAALVAEAPPLAALRDVSRTTLDVEDRERFVLEPSAHDGAARPAIPPDVVMCPACADDVADPANRRHRYPFTTCTDCGPRYSVITAMPYDREHTTLATFRLCAECRREYDDPADRRYRAESIACPACGPQLWLEVDGRRIADGDDALREAARRLASGGIVALRGLGGFHIACDATDATAVAELRRRKRRDAKPLAVMVATIADAERLADLDAADRRLLTARERPIVLVRAKPGALAAGIAPGLSQVGLMLAYTPLHLLLLEAVGVPLVMTSGNLSDEPIAADLAEGRERLAPLVDAVLLHDREIAARIDDSVVRPAGAAPVLIRRARGFAPLAIALPQEAPHPVLAVGPHLKHTLAFAVGRDCWVGPHGGDLDTFEALAHVAHLRDALLKLIGARPAVVATDLHGGYLSHRLADPWPDLPRVAVQHHHAHIAAVMAEHGVTQRVLGIAYDGTGAGDDGTSWGAEFLFCDLAGYSRVGHWLPVTLPGGDRASREGWRAAVGYGMAAAAQPFDLAFDGVEPAAVEQAMRQGAARVNAPVATSIGRLFDAVAALAGVRSASAFEGQAAMELEALADGAAALPAGAALDRGWVTLDDPLGQPLVVSPLALLRQVAAWRTLDPSAGAVRAAAALHGAVVDGTVAAALRLTTRYGLDTVVLGGGTWQNVRLLRATAHALGAAGLRVLVPRALPPNDGGISYGQAAVAIARTYATESATGWSGLPR